MSRKQDWDDGRTIADMSEVERPSLLRPRQTARTQEPKDEPHRTWEDAPISKQDRWLVALGALKAALLIALVFLVGLALVVFLLLRIWT